MGKNTNKSTHKLVWKPDPTDTLEFITVIDDVDATIPLVEIVDTFEVFTTNVGGNQGLLERPSKQQLDSIFGTHKDDDIMVTMIQKGEIKESNDAMASKYNNRNDAGGVSFGAMKGGAGGR